MESLVDTTIVAEDDSVDSIAAALNEIDARNINLVMHAARSVNDADSSASTDESAEVSARTATAVFAATTEQTRRLFLSPNNISCAKYASLEVIQGINQPITVAATVQTTTRQKSPPGSTTVHYYMLVVFYDYNLYFYGTLYPL
jgi:hypothetical protein